MAVSRNSGKRRPVDRTPFSLDGLPSPSRYDLLLAAIPAALLLSIGAYLLFGVSPSLATLPVGIVGTAVLADALFIHPPGTTESDHEDGESTTFGAD